MENPTLANAQAILSRLINAKPLGHETEGNSQFLNANVTIDTGLSTQWREDKLNNETLRLTIETPEVNQHPGKTKDALEKIIQDIPFIDEFVQARTQEEEIGYVKSKLEELIEAGADIPKSTLKWAGFNKENDERWEMEEYLVRAHSDDAGIRAHLELPSHLPDNVKEGTIKDAIENNIEAIKKTVVERIIRDYKGNLDKDAVRAQAEKLEFTVLVEDGQVYEGERHSGSVKIDIQSPEQKEEVDNRKAEGKTLDVDPKLKDTNILQQLDIVDINKAVSKAVQTAGDKALKEDIIPVIIGAHDMRNKLENALNKFKEDHPEQEHKVADVLNSDVLTGGWKAQTEKFTKHEIEYVKNKEERGKMVFEMVVPEGKASEIIQKLSDMDPEAAKQQTAQPQTMQQQLQRFATVDSMQVIGAYSPHPELHAQLQAAVAPLIGQTFSGNDAADQMKPFAEKLVSLVEKMHAEKTTAMDARAKGTDISASMANLLVDLEEAHQTITDGVTLGAQQAAATGQVAPAPTAPTDNTGGESVPALMSTMFSQLDKTQQILTDGITGQQEPTEAEVKKVTTSLLAEVDRAHQNAVDGIKNAEAEALGATVEKTAAPSATQEALNTKENANASTLAGTPSSVMTPSWIQQLVDKTQNKGSYALGA